MSPEFYPVAITAAILISFPAIGLCGVELIRKCILKKNPKKDWAAKIQETLDWAFIATEFSLPTAPAPEGFHPDHFTDYREKRERFQREINHLKELAEKNTPPLEIVESLRESIEFHGDALNKYHLAWAETNPKEKPSHFQTYQTSLNFLRTTEKYIKAVENYNQ